MRSLLGSQFCCDAPPPQFSVDPLLTRERSTPSQKFLAAKRVSRTAPETTVTATMLIRLCVAIDNVEKKPPGWLPSCALPFAAPSFFALESQRTAGQAAWQPDPD